LQEVIVQQVRIDRIIKAQEEKKWIADVKTYLIGDVATLPAEELKIGAVIAPEYEFDRSELLFFCSRSSTISDICMEHIRLVVPELLQQDFLHHYHTSVEGGHQGIGRTYQRIRARFHGRGMYRSVQRYIGTCVD